MNPSSRRTSAPSKSAAMPSSTSSKTADNQTQSRLPVFIERILISAAENIADFLAEDSTSDVQLIIHWQVCSANSAQPILSPSSDAPIIIGEIISKPGSGTWANHRVFHIACANEDTETDDGVDSGNDSQAAEQ